MKFLYANKIKKKGLLLFYVSNSSYLPIKILKIWRLLKYSVKLVKKNEILYRI